MIELAILYFENELIKEKAASKIAVEELLLA